MSPLRSRLLWKAFLSVVLGLALWFPIFYWLTVPLVNRLAYQMEETAARTVLNNVAAQVGQSYRDLETWRQSALEAHRRELKNIVLLVESWARQLEADVAAGKLPRAAARRELLAKLQLLRYGNNDYLWAADYRSVFLAHPDAGFHGRYAGQVRDSQGNLVLPPMVEGARRAGEGYFSYRWEKLDTGAEGEKLSYVRDFPAWQMVVGTGVYIDDVDQEVARRREAMVADLRQRLRQMKVAESGYVFIVDGKGKVIAHPDSRLEGQELAGASEPVRTVVAGLMAAAGQPERTFFYQWNRPDDPGRYTYPKVAWVHHFPEADWYLAASAYVDDLGRNGQHLSERLLVAFILGLVITALMAFAFIRTLTGPILHLAAVARRAMVGDLSAVADVRRRDEIGVLAEAFNRMVARLKDHIAGLEQRVGERTRELQDLAAELETRVEARTAEAKAAEARFRGLLEQSLAGIFVIQDGLLRYANPRFAEIYGFADSTAIIGALSWEQLVAPADLETLAELRRRLAAGEMERCEVSFCGRRRDGSSVDLEMSAAPIDYEGKPAVIGVALDVSERKKIQEALENQQQQLEQMVATRTSQLETANQQLQAFTSAASHDLRSPLRGIRSFAFLLQQNYGAALAGDGLLYLEHIQRSARRMGELIEDLLAHAQLEQESPDLKSVDLAAAIEEALAERREEIRQKGAEVRVQPVAATVLAEPQGLAQALRNILENALKYCAPGRAPLIQIGCRETEGGCALWIRDNGIGFDMAYHDRIFEMFRRLHTYDEYPGSGVGLALVKKAMERMGGRVWATSAPGLGTTFHLGFQVAAAMPALRQAA